MFKNVKIHKIDLTFTFRHKWDTDNKYLSGFSAYDLGLFYKRSKIFTFDETTLINRYIIGINLIICKMWIAINKNN